MSIATEQRTLIRMFSIYCRAVHGNRGRLCGDCKELLDYSLQRLSHCIYGEGKPSCKNCPVHCYRPAEREAVKAVMRFAGPRMLWYHPVLALRHWMKK